VGSRGCVSSKDVAFQPPNQHKSNSSSTVPQSRSELTAFQDQRHGGIPGRAVYRAQNGHNRWRKECAMLVLSRKKDQTVCIGSDIRVTILHVAKDRVKIGIQAPYKVRILRGELRTPPGSRQIPMAVDSDCCALETATTLLATHALHLAR
jgi:carbon storage regulator CsrA